MSNPRHNHYSENEYEGEIISMSKTGKIALSVTVVAFFFIYLFVTLWETRRVRRAVAPAPLPEARPANETQRGTISVGSVVVEV
jgi:hypothetical protein